MAVPADNNWICSLIETVMGQKKRLLVEIEEIQEEITKRVEASIWNPKYPEGE